jgi:hypothetical protein
MAVQIEVRNDAITAGNSPQGSVLGRAAQARRRLAGRAAHRVAHPDRALLRQAALLADLPAHLDGRR